MTCWATVLAISLHPAPCSTRTANSSPRAAPPGRCGHTALQAAADLDEQPVAGVVPEAVVDRLEVVEVDEQHDVARRAGPVPGDRPLDPVAKLPPVGEPSQRVVEGAVDQLVLERLALVDDAVVDDDPLDGGLVEQVGDGRLHPAPGAPRVEQPELDRLGLRGVRDDGPAGRICGRPVLRVHEVLARHAEPVPGGPAEDALDGGRLVLEPSLAVDDRDHVGGPLHERGEALLALTAHPGRCGPRRGLPPGMEEVGHELAAQDEEQAPAHPVSHGLRSSGGAVGRQQRTGDDGRRDPGHERAEGTETEPRHEDGDAEPQRGDGGGAPQGGGGDPRDREQHGDDHEGGRGGEVGEAEPADDRAERGARGVALRCAHSALSSGLPAGLNKSRKIPWSDRLSPRRRAVLSAGARSTPRPGTRRRPSRRPPLPARRARAAGPSRRGSLVRPPPSGSPS